MERLPTVILAFCLAVAVVFVRAPDAFFAPQFWAEDANVFWIAQYQHGFAASLLAPYAGYLHAVPRLIAALASPLPYGWQPIAYLVLALAVTGWAAATIAALPLPRWLAALAGICVLIVAPRESLANPTNLQWMMAPALPLIAATSAPAGSLARVNQLVFVALASLSGPFSALMIPLWLVCLAVRGRSAFDLALTALALAAGLAQIVVLARGDPAIAADVSTVGSLSTAVAEALGTLLRSWPRWLALAAGIVLLAWSVLAGRFRFQRTICVAFSGLVLCAVAWKFRSGTDWVKIFDGRYVHVPAAMALFCALSLLFERGVAKCAGAFGCIALALAASRTFVRAPVPNFGQQWQEASPLIGTRPVEVPIAPSWKLEIPPR